MTILAQEFSREWIWFEESEPAETAVERARFRDYGYPVRAANLRSEKLRKVLRPESGGLAFGSFGEGAVPVILRRLPSRALNSRTARWPLADVLRVHRSAPQRAPTPAPAPSAVP